MIRISMMKSKNEIDYAHYTSDLLVYQLYYQNNIDDII